MTSSAPPTLLAMDILLPLLFLIAPGFVFLLGQSRFSNLFLVLLFFLIQFTLTH